MAESPYVQLARALDTNFQGIPKRDGEYSSAFLEYLELLFTPEEAEVASCLGVGAPFTTSQEVAEKTGRLLEEVQKPLDALTERKVIIGGGGAYTLPIMGLVVNYHQLREKLGGDDIKAGELYQEFFIRDGFYRFYESGAEGTPLRRAIPVNEAVEGEQKVLSHEELDHVLDNALDGFMALVPCPCRTRTDKLGIRECKDENPVASCLFIGNTARGAVHQGIGKPIDREQADQYVAEVRELPLVTMVNNHKDFDDGIICFCCGCCCSISRGITRWDNPRALARSDFVARVSDECIACGICEDRCIFGAIALPEDADQAVVDEEKCMGCGVCTVTCSSESLKLYRLEREPIFEDGMELTAKVTAENVAAGQSNPRSE
jgi:ferredoxin